MPLKVGVGLFTGQIPPGSDRTFEQEYRDIVELSRVAERAGLDAVWVSEHHCAQDGYLPSLLPIMAAIAVATERVEIGTGVVLAPFHHPLRLAEDFAVVDQLSGGRTICGLAAGWRDEEFRAFGVPVRERVARLRELVAVLRAAWTQERFDHSGRIWRFEQVAVTPKPARVPPILIGGFVDAAVRRAGRIGDGYLSSRAAPDRVRQCFELAARARAEAGLSGPPVVGVLQNAWVARDPEADWPQVSAGIRHQLGTYAGWRNGTDVPGRSLEVAPLDDDQIRALTAVGTPEEVVDRLRPLVEAFSGFEQAHLVLRLHYPGMGLEPAASAIELLGAEVAPRLREMASG